jgi:SH3-like domain-containing protein
MYKILNLLIIFIMSITVTCANNKKPSIPRFVSLKVSEANIRTGPGTKFPIKWIFVKKNLPLEILDHYENWYNIRDEEQKQGWIHLSLVKSSRFFVTIKEQVALYKNPKHNYISHLLEGGSRGSINSCRNKWCEVKIDNIQGWIKKPDMWGVYQHEEF